MKHRLRNRTHLDEALFALCFQSLHLCSICVHLWLKPVVIEAHAHALSGDGIRGDFVAQLALEENDVPGLRGIMNERLVFAARFGATRRRGHEAVEAILARSFACIIMDMQMPVLDGYSAASAMRAGGYAGGILGLTANDAPELLARALEIERKAQATITSPRGLGGQNNRWADWLAMDAAQAKLMLDIEPHEIPCGCVDG